MTKETTYITGLREVVRNLEKIIGDASDMKQVFTEIGQMVATDASHLAPRRTGKLAGVIKPTKTKNKAAVRAGSARVPYAGPINYGWPRRGIRASLFLQRAIEADTNKAIEMMEHGLGVIIARVLGGTE